MFNFFNLFKVFSLNAAGDFTIKINGSCITFLSTGDILIKAKRHMIVERDLHFDNCPQEMVQEAILIKELGDKAYNDYVDKFINIPKEDGRQSSNNEFCDRSGSSTAG